MSLVRPASTKYGHDTLDERTQMYPASANQKFTQPCCPFTDQSSREQRDKNSTKRSEIKQDIMNPKRRRIEL